jgi:hypothetical protein
MFLMSTSQPSLESSILFSFETDFTGRVKAEPQIETWQRRSAAAFTPAVILFIALPEAKDNIDPRVIPLALLPRQCPVCGKHTIIGHGRRLRQSHDDQRESIWVRRGICYLQAHDCVTRQDLFPRNFPFFVRLNPLGGEAIAPQCWA